MKGLILVTGSEGLVGSRFVEISERKNFLHLPKEVELDITNKSEIQAIIESYNFSAVVNFAAFTNVGEAEKERGNKDSGAWQVNVEGVKNFAESIKPFRERIHFIQISTDMVFPGSEDDPGPYLESHLPESDPAKLSWYGYTKAEGERVVREVLGNSATIVRIIYPVRAEFSEKLDYLRKPLALFDEGKLYPLFSDQQISISFIDEVCKALDKIIIDNTRGTFHVGSDDTTTPNELISYMIKLVRGVDTQLDSITIKDFLAKTNGSDVRYPKFGGLKVEETAKKLNMKFSSWRQIVDKLIAQGLGKKS